MKNREKPFPEIELSPRRKTTARPGQPAGWGINRQTFWTVGAALSILLNIGLVLLVIVFAAQYRNIRSLLTDQVVGGLYYNFVRMDQASIETNILVEDRITVRFDLPLQQDTVVILTEDTLIEDATVSMNTGGLNIQRAPTDIVLPEGTRLPVRLDLTIPVETKVPIQLNVPVRIPLAETELHEPFVGLQNVVAPFFWLLVEPSQSWPSLQCQYWGISCP
jgi:hypothetical protein